jgi:ABC-type antimicrobial peptide transport system permease subunit
MTDHSSPASPELVGFALAFSVLMGLVCGIYPAFIFN